MKKYKNFKDIELVNLFREGDERAFGELINRYTRTISASLFNLIKDPILIEDILQDTWMKVMEKLKLGEYEGKNFAGWVHVIARNHFIDLYRIKKKKKIFFIPENINESDFFTKKSAKQESPEELIILSEIDFDLDKILKMLPDEQREVFVLRIFNNFSFREIAEYLGDGTPLNTVLGRMRYALINIRKILKEKNS